MTIITSALPTEERLEIVSSRISTLDIVILGLENGLSLEWVKPEADTRQQELDDYISVKGSLLAEKESLEAL